MAQKLLSIVVPTKNRYYYLEKLIELVDSFKSTEIELVIQDNSDDNSQFLNFLNGRYSFVVYNHVQGQIPMSTNSDKAILNSHGEYICFIGDDDGIVRYIVDCARWMKKNKIDAVLPYIVKYNWPESKKGRYIDNRASVLCHKFSNKISYRDCKKELMKLISEGFTSRGKLPLAYHGIVSRQLLDRIFAIGETYFPGSSPDISNAVAVSLSTEKYAYIDAPLTISGAGQYHGGGTDNMKTKDPDLKDIPWLLPGAIDNWDPNVPKIGIGEAIWCDSAIKALKYMSRDDLVEKINYKKLYLKISANFPSQRQALSKKIGSPFFSNLMMIYEKYITYFKMTVTLLLSKMGYKANQVVYKNINNIIEAESLLANQYVSPFDD